ncbi:MAG: hypothetical protein KDB20_17475, partial [Microthrixaceae bacterium]|nr:hypothetical protein [Microthrixaceae bacterium]
MAVEHESTFEQAICTHLHDNGWEHSHSSNDKGYDVARALYPPDLFAWLEDTQPDQWAKIVKP